MLCAILKCVDLILYILYSNMTLSFSVKSVGCLTKVCLNWNIFVELRQGSGKDRQGSDNSDAS